MKKATAITCLLLDIGGALLGNGWDHHACKRAAKVFDPDLTEMEERHHLTFFRLRKSDADIFRLALDIAQVPAQQVVYIENTPMFVQIAEGLGIRSILHADFSSTRAKLASFGLQNE
jgi:FMN phosphatase YigB (HAD superfamily)